MPSPKVPSTASTQAGSMRPRPHLGPDVWELRVRCGLDPDRPRDDAGHPRYKRVSRNFHGTKRQATVALRDFVAEVERNRLAAADVRVPTVAEHFDTWLAFDKGTLAYKTWHDYRSKADTWWIPAFGHKRLDEVTPAEIDAVYNEMRKVGRASHTLRLGKASIKRAYNVAIRWGLVTVNPAALASQPQGVSPEVIPPSLEEFETILAEVKASRTDSGPMLLFLRLAAATGARPGELCGLQWRDVAMEGWELAIARSVVEHTGGEIEIKRTKGNNIRRLRIDANTRRLLMEHNRAMVAAAGKPLAMTSFVFSTDPDGKTPWRPGRPTLVWSRCRKRVGLKYRLYSLRHLHATQLLAAGVPITVVAQRLGHSVAVCQKTYAHAIPGRDEQAADAIESFLDGGGNDSVAALFGDSTVTPLRLVRSAADV